MTKRIAQAKTMEDIIEVIATLERQVYGEPEPVPTEEEVKDEKVKLLMRMNKDALVEKLLEME